MRLNRGERTALAMLLIGACLLIPNSKSFVASIVMCAAVILTGKSLNGVSMPVIVKLVAEVLTGGIVYLVMSLLLKIDVFRELLGFVRRRKQ